jgi:phospholipase C
VKNFTRSSQLDAYTKTDMVNGYVKTALCWVLAMWLASCGGRSQQAYVPTGNPLPNAAITRTSTIVGAPAAALPTPIQHIVIIVQENRTPDYLFQGIPGADIAETAVDSKDQTVRLHAVSLGAHYDLGHSHHDFLKDYAGGKMDGFDQGIPPFKHLNPFGYAPASEARPYHDMAEQYVFADHMFQSNQGPSFPSHLYLVSGTATDAKISEYRVSDNPHDGTTGHTRGGGCDAPPSTKVRTVNVLDGSQGPDIYPCLNRPVLSDFLDKKGVTWRYYQDSLGAGLWHPFDAIRHVRYGSDYANVITPPESILTDIKNGHLAGLSWVIPDGAHSDHPGSGGHDKGPSWVAAVVNAVGMSSFWKNTAIFVTWDDWGGWYDHVPPPIENGYELGFRVPLVVISPYAKRAYVSKVQHEFGSILAFSEETFGIPKGALNATDARADDLMDAFDFGQQPRKFVPIKAPPFHPSAGEDASDEDP